ncbi:THO complex subunit 4D-like [Malus domestica]|uniref:THO complex subunit 4D-like n=1 Tax=Malus domestica TaxID=3750 RepID=UPI0010AA5F50|nr:THO complex subunit 4D-like isoform X4 [Malus domestica]
MSTALDMSLDDMIKNSRGNRERNREQRGRGSRGRGGPRGSFNAGRMAAGRIPAGRMASGRIPAGRMTGGVRRGPLTVNARPSSYTIAKSTRRTKRFPWQPDLFEDSLRAAGISGIEIGTKLYVSNLDYGVTNEDIRELFSEIGELKRYAVHFDKNGRPSGSAEVVYTRRSDAFAALKRYNNVLLDGKPMKIEIVGANAGMPISARVNVTGMHGRKKRTVVMTPGPGNAGGYAMPMVNRGPSRSSRGGNRNGRGKPRGNGSGSGRGRGRGRGGEGRKKPVEKSVDELDKELDSYHADNMQDPVL